jgi:hypothetical protein
MERPEPRALLATDGSEEATAAVRVAARLASASGSELHVVHVGELMPVYHPERHSYPAQYDTIRDEARHLLDEQVEQLRVGGCRSLRHTSRWATRTARSSRLPRGSARAWSSSAAGVSGG